MRTKIILIILLTAAIVNAMIINRVPRNPAQAAPPPAGDYIVADAGTAAVNGGYTENGTWGPSPAYELAGGSHWMYKNTGPSWWEIATTKGGTALYHNGAFSTLPTSSAWAVGTGDAPAPTVTTP